MQWAPQNASPAHPVQRCGGAELLGAGVLRQPAAAAAAMVSPSVSAAWEGLSQHLETAYAAVLPLPSVAGASGLAAAFEALELLRGLGGLGEAELMVSAGQGSS